MALSMTAFVEEEVKIEHWGSFYIELKSINQRGLEIQLRLPEEFSFLEEEMRKKIQEKIRRGRLICTIKPAQSFLGEVFLNKELLNNYIQKIEEIRGLFKINTPIDLGVLVNLPGVFSMEKTKILHRKEAILNLKNALDKVLEKLIQARKREGKFLEKHILGCINKIEAKIGLIKERFKELVAEKLNDFNTEEEKLSFLRTTDIAEELKRLEFHIKNFKTQLKKDIPVGKELDFVAQEMLREANTISAKSFDAKIVWWLVKVRSEIEQVRQQLQNIE